jgi:H+-transporting ATPase
MASTELNTSEKEPLITDAEKNMGLAEDETPYYKGATENNLPAVGPKYKKEELYNTDPHTGLTQSEAEDRLKRFGRNELVEEEVNIWWLLLKEFIQPMPIIVWLAIIIESVESIIEYAEGETGPGNSDMIDVVCLIFLQFLNVFVGFIEEMKANEAIKALKQGLLPKATVKRVNAKGESVTQAIDASVVVPGDIMVLRIGGNVPADGSLCQGAPIIQVDTSQLTGESLPQEVGGGGLVLMGSMVSTGETEAMVELTGCYTFFGKAADLLQKDEEAMGHFEKILQNLLIVLVVIGVIVNVTIFIYLECLNPPPKLLSVLAFAVVLLIASIPIALRVVCVTTLALGCRYLTEHGAIVSKLTAVEELASMTLLCSDKTGTLTLNKMMIQDDDQKDPTFRLEKDKQGDFKLTPDKQHTPQGRMDLIMFSALAAKWWEPPGDALDTLVLKASGCFKPKKKDPTPADTAAQAECVKAQDRLKAQFNFDTTAFQPFDPAKKRTEARLEIVGEQNLLPNLRVGDAFKVTKGAPNIIMDMCDNTKKGGEDNQWCREQFDVCVDKLASRGVRAIAVAISTKNDFVKEAGKQVETKVGVTQNGWQMIGLIAFLDPPRPDTQFTIEKANEFGVDVKMVTGDHKKIAEETSRVLGLKTNVLAAAGNLPVYENAKELRELAEDADNKKALGQEWGQKCNEAGGFAEVFPEHKYLIVAAIQQLAEFEGKPVGMTGDGVNDAPALHKADVGIAVEGSTDAAKAAADIVLTEPGLSTVVVALVISRKIFTRMKNFVVYRVACTEQLLFFFLIACLTYNPQDYYLQSGAAPEFFDLPVIALVTIVILNDGTIISVAFDNVDASRQPEVWNMSVLYLVASVVGGVALASSICLLQWSFCAAATDVNGMPAPQGNPFTSSGIAETFKIDTLEYSQIRTMMYLKIALSDYLSLFNCRNQSWFFSRAPSRVVVGAALFSTLISSLLSCTWPFGSDMTGIPIETCVFVWLYVACWGLVQDSFKVLTYWFVTHTGMLASTDCIDDGEVDAITKKATEINLNAGDD